MDLPFNPPFLTVCGVVCSVVCGAERDDKTHGRGGRDLFLENDPAAGVPLVCVQTREHYDVAELRNLLRGLEVPRAA